MNRCLDGAVSLSTPWGWEAEYYSQYNNEAIGLGSNSGRHKRFLSLPKCPDQLWTSPRWSIHSSSLTSWLHVMSSLRMSEAVSVLALLSLMDRDNFIFAFYNMGMRTC